MFSSYNLVFILLQINLKTVHLLNSSDFHSALTSPAFVDKTMLIKRVLESTRYVTVAIPSRRGKSTAIDMIKTFLEVEVDKYGDPRTNFNITNEVVNDTSNFFCFVNNKLEITKHLVVMRELGRTPVISVDFKWELPPTGLECLYDVIKVCKGVVHRSLKEHEYLLYSEFLSLEDKQLIRTWCDEHSYKTKVDNMFISHGLLSLSRFLHKHFSGRKVFVLVDNYDFLISTARKSVSRDSELTDIVKFVYSMISDLVCDNGNLVGGAFIAGESKMAAADGFNLTNFEQITVDSFLV